MGDTPIEWTRVPGPGGKPKRGRSWNPVTGCELDCSYCYARKFAERWRGIEGHPYEQGFDVRLWPERLKTPIAWKEPSGVFVDSMSDLFQAKVPFDFIHQVMETIRETPQHTYILLTKAPVRMWRFFRDREVPDNLWIGTSVDNQRRAKAGVPPLLAISARVKFLSCEPLLERIDLATDEYVGDLGVDWVIAGAMSGPGATPAPLDWFRDIRDACTETGTPLFIKQFADARGHKIPTPELDGKQWIEYPRLST